MISWSTGDDFFQESGFVNWLLCTVQLTHEKNDPPYLVYIIFHFLMLIQHIQTQNSYMIFFDEKSCPYTCFPMKY